MWSFRKNYLLEHIDLPVANLMASLGRFQGRQRLYSHQVPQILDTLRQIAIVESTESSNRIEGIVVPQDRFDALMAQAAPKNRSEGEIIGYREVLTRIHTGQVSHRITPQLILDLYADLYAHVPEMKTGWKQEDNIIRQILPDGREAVRFVPLPADETPDAMEELCQRFREMWDRQQQIDRLLTLHAFILDFECIHPFSDGNGRMGRLLTLLLLYAAGYEVGRYISLERIIENTKLTYYDALLRSGRRWDTGHHDLNPWYQYSLSVIIYAYREFEERVGQLAAAPGTKSQAVQLVIETLVPGDSFTVTDLEQACPDVSRTTIRRVLNDLRDREVIECLSTGRGAQWRKT
jgi:Fic family protein